MEKYIKLIKDYSRGAYKKLTRPPMGRLKHPFLVPGAVYEYDLWDWDSWLTDVGIRQILADNSDTGEDFLACERGCILNFLDYTDEDGRMPIVVDAHGKITFLDGRKNIHKPCIAQHLAFILKMSGEDCSWVRDKVYKLEAFLDFYRKNYKHSPTGLYFFGDDTAIGVDNDPAIFYRPEDSTASIYLNCLMYRELLAMAYILRLIGRGEDAPAHESEAEELRAAINEHLYDERCGMYYSADLNLLPVDENQWLHKGAPRDWHSLLLKVDSWSGFMALWSGVATPERALRVVRENMLDERTFLGKHGVRSLSRLEKMYRIEKTGNPSCWLGPVWGICAYMCFRGLVNYGFDTEARDLAQRTVALFGRDIAECGEMHEYYHPDTGEGVNNQGFQSWNLLVNNMIAYLEGRDAVREY